MDHKCLWSRSCELRLAAMLFLGVVDAGLAAAGDRLPELRWCMSVSRISDLGLMSTV